MVSWLLAFPLAGLRVYASLQRGLVFGTLPIDRCDLVMRLYEPSMYGVRRSEIWWSLTREARLRNTSHPPLNGRDSPCLK